MAESRVRPSALSQLTWFSSSHYLAQVLFFVRGLFLARLLGLYDFGVWTSMRAVRDLGKYLSMGAPEGMEQLAPFSEAAGRGRDAHRLRSVAAGIVVVAAVVAACWIVYSGLEARSKGDEARSLEWIVFAGVFILVQLGFFGFAVQRSVHGFRSISLVAILVILISMLGLTAIPRFGLLGFLVVLGVSQGLGVAILARLPPRVRPSLRGDTAKELFAAGFPIMGANFLGTLQWNLDKIFIWVFLGQSNLGVYGLSLHLVNAVMILPRSAAAVLYPRLREELGRTGAAQVDSTQVMRLTRLLGLLMIPLLGILWVVLQYLVLLAFPEYLEAVAPGRILLLGIYLPVWAGLTTPILVSQGRQRLLIGTRLLGLAVTCLGLILVQRSGSSLVLIAIATACGLSVQAGFAMLATFRVLEIPRREWLRWVAGAGLGWVAFTLVLINAVGLYPVASISEVSVGQIVTSTGLVAILSLWLTVTAIRQYRKWSVEQAAGLADRERVAGG